MRYDAHGTNTTLHTGGLGVERVEQRDDQIDENSKVERRSAPQRHVATQPVQTWLRYTSHIQTYDDDVRCNQSLGRVLKTTGSHKKSNDREHVIQANTQVHGNV